MSRLLTALTVAAAMALAACGSTVPPAARQQAARNAAGRELGGGSADAATATTAPPDSVRISPAQGQTDPHRSGGSGATGSAAAKVATTGPISVGFLNQTFAQASQFGINTASGHSTQETYDAVVNALNKSGGLHGRRIAPVFSNVNLTGNWEADYAAACSAFTEDHHVVVVLGYSLLLNPAFETCLTKRGVAHLSAGSPNGDDALLRANPNLFMTAYPTADGVYLTELTGAVQTGVITKTSKVGLIRFDCDWDQRAWKHVGQPFVTAHNVNVVKTQLLSCPTSATDVSGRDQAQIDGAVLQFNSAGVDTVIANGAAQYFAKAAASQRYSPQYVITTVDTSEGLQTQNVPQAQMQNMHGFGWYPILDTDAQHRPAPPAAQAAAQQRCLALAKSQGYVPSDADFQQLFTTCDTLFLYERALASTGGVATAPEIARALLSLNGAYASITALDGAVAFSASHHDGPAAWRPFKWDTGCSCFVYTSPSQPMPARS